MASPSPSLTVDILHSTTTTGHPHVDSVCFVVQTPWGRTEINFGYLDGLPTGMQLRSLLGKDFYSLNRGGGLARKTDIWRVGNTIAFTSAVHAAWDDCPNHAGDHFRVELPLESCRAAFEQAAAALEAGYRVVQAVETFDASHAVQLGYQAVSAPKQ